MKFIHFADCHLDGFRDYKLAKLGFLNFSKVISEAITQKVDFVLLAGDLFNTAIPRVEALKFATKELKRLADKNIPCYAIAGSHDYSPNGKTVLDVLEIAGLLTLVMKGEITNDGKLQLEFTKDEKTGALITGIIGKKGMLDSKYYAKLDTSKLQGEGFKIFMFHTALEELKTKEVENMPGHSISLLPTSFDYYAGGHVHVIKRYSDANYKNVVYPGPTFPNSFSELEQLKKGSYILYDDANTENPYEHKFLEPKVVTSYAIDASSKTAQELQDELLKLSGDVPDQAIALLRIQGTLKEGNVKDVELDQVVRSFYQDGAFLVLKNTIKLQSASFAEQEIQASGDVESVERETIAEHKGQIPLAENLEEESTIQLLLEKLQVEQIDGETKGTYQERVLSIAKSILEE